MISFMVALPLLIAAISKSVDSGFFLRSLDRILPIPKILLPLCALVILGINWFLVSGLLFQNCSFFIRPLGFVFLGMATLITLIRWLIRPSHSCDCYGPGITVHPLLSVLINIACLVGLWFLPMTPCVLGDIQYNASLVMVGIILGRFSVDAPLWDLSATAPGKIWKEEAIPHSTHIVAYLSPSCASCTPWFPLLISAHRTIPVSIVGSEEFVQLPETLFLLHKENEQIFQRIERFPTVLAIKDHRIVHRWRKSPPQNFLEEIARLD